MGTSLWHLMWIKTSECGMWTRQKWRITCRERTKSSPRSINTPTMFSSSTSRSIACSKCATTQTLPNTLVQTTLSCSRARSTASVLSSCSAAHRWSTCTRKPRILTWSTTNPRMISKLFRQLSASRTLPWSQVTSRSMEERSSWVSQTAQSSSLTCLTRAEMRSCPTTASEVSQSNLWPWLTSSNSSKTCSMTVTRLQLLLTSR